MPEEQPSIAPNEIGIKLIPTEQLHENPHNPRMLFDEVPLGALRTSIAKAGILVPLTVYWSARKGWWVILDGQRRWMCAKAVGLQEVPCNQVAEPTVEENIITMFQIHKLRDDWQLMPTALKLELLMKRLKETREKAIAEITGLDQAQVVRCKKLLTFDRRHQDLMLTANPDQRVKADFFIELHTVLSDRYVRKMPWFKRNRFIDRMLAKYEKRAGLKSVTDFRMIKQRVTNAVKAGRVQAITKRLQEFTHDDELTIDHLDIEDAAQREAARKLRKAVMSLADRLHGLDADTLYGEEELWNELERLAKLIQEKLLEAGRRAKGGRRGASRQS